VKYPTLSVIIANYNYGCFIEEAINSVLNQDFPQEEIEIVVVDYGSTDDSREKIIKYDKKVNTIFLDKGDYIKAINEGILVSRGKYIAFLGADDKWKREKSRIQIEFLEKNPEVGLVYTDATIINEYSEVIYPSFWRWENIIPYRGYVLDKLLIKNFVSGGTMMVRHRDRHLFYPIPESKGFEKCEDWWIVFNIARRHPIDFIPSQLTLYRLHTRNQVLRKGFTFNRSNAILVLNQETERRIFMIDIVVKDEKAKISKSALNDAINYNKKRILQKTLLGKSKIELIKFLWAVFKGKTKADVGDFPVILKAMIQSLNPNLYTLLARISLELNRNVRFKLLDRL